MKTKELLLECKIKLKINSDYALGKAMGISRQTISHYMKEQQRPDDYACFKIAETLGREPAEVIAEINGESNSKHADYFKDFLQRRALVGIGAALLLTCSSIYAPESNAAEFSQFRIMGRLRRKSRPSESALTSPEVRGFFLGW
jgi:transcriptional regulator with XRE-family HTH domain